MSAATISVSNVGGLLGDLSGEGHSNIAHVDPKPEMAQLYYKVKI